MLRPTYSCCKQPTYISSCDNATMVDAKAHLLTVQTKTVTTPQWWMLRPTYSLCKHPPTSPLVVTTPQWWMLRPTYALCKHPTYISSCDNVTMVDAKARLLTVQAKTVTTPQWWMLRPTYVSTCDNATMVDAKAHVQRPSVNQESDNAICNDPL